MSLCLLFTAQAQFLSPGVFQPAPEGYWVGVEEVTTHSDGDLNGLTTSRIYLHCLNTEDYLSSISGDDENVFELNTTTTWYQEENGSALGWEMNPAFFQFVPNLEYDSWLTIGEEDANGGSTLNYIASTLAGVPDPMDVFESGSNVVMNDAVGSAIFAPFPGIEN
ncbi:MAG: hypothetical protein QMC37_00805 [Flavobacteriales bacterium]